MLVKISEILKSAKEGHYGVPAFLAYDESTARACLKAAEECRAPVILLCGGTQSPDLLFYGSVMNDLAVRSSVPVATILDHSPTFEDAMLGIRAGFNTIMVDRSSLSYEENRDQVKELTRIAHACGVEVEAELGHVGIGVNYAQDGSSALTVPEEAVRFVEETGVDCLAVAIGSAHGVYKGTPKLRFELLDELAEKVPVPLVLHGGSGTGSDNLTEACRRGICKVNIANDLLRSGFHALIDDGMEGNHIYSLPKVMADGYCEKAKELIGIFGCAGKA